MAEKSNYSILGFLYSNQFYLLIYFSTFFLCCCSYEANAVPYDSFTISSFSYGRTLLRPYDWRYIRVDLPTSFSSMTISLESDVNLDKNSVRKAGKYNPPIICVREGSPPLPDSYNTSLIGLVLDHISNESLGTQSLQFAEKCYHIQKNILLILTNEQISPGVWYFGLFNGIGSTRTQSKMINRGSGYSFSGNVSIEGCMLPGKYNPPIICVREGSPPLPDSYNTSLIGLVLDHISNESLGTQSLQFAEKCYHMQKNILLILTNEQISPGVWYFGLFNGIGSTRTQSKMINRGSGYSFSGNVSIEGCMGPFVSGPFCNQTVNQLSCVDQNLMHGKVASCRNNPETSCSDPNEPKVYSLDILGVSEEIMISYGTSNRRNISLMCYVRHGAMSSVSVHDYSGNIIDAPLVIQSPKVGRWYITIIPLIVANETMGNMKVCYSLLGQVRQCPQNKAGFNCTWERYVLQTVLRKNPALPFESYYLPVTDYLSSHSSSFLLEPLLSNSSLGQSQSQSQSQDFAWTYFVVDIPSGASGGSIHIRLNSNTKLNHEIYVLYGGLPYEDKWDYFYANSTSNSYDSMFFKLYDSDEKTIGFYIVYVRGGIWSVGIKHLTSAHKSQSQTMMSISIERCPRKCSSHGTCQNVVEMSGLSLYSYCSCDRTHGGFDCSVEIVSHQGWTRRAEPRDLRGSEFGSQSFEQANFGHIWQSVSLIASNSAFVFPAYWALRQKAFAEWVLYTSSGISSGLYHACDVGTWCALPFHVLQFMDFWLSFMAVVSTFVYLAAIDEASKRTIHTIVAILTALMAETGATRSSNIVLVIAIGATGLLAGWLIEFFTHYRRFSFSAELFLNMLQRWKTIKGWFHNLMKTLLRRFRWFFVVAGFVALAVAAVSWSLESSESYWFWHSMWHVSIYTSSFFFLRSKVNKINCENEGSTDAQYQLTRQDSLSRSQDQP